MTDKRLEDIRDAARSFYQVVDAATTAERLDLVGLLDAYIDTRQRLTRFIAQIAATQFPNAEKELRAVVVEIQALVNQELAARGQKPSAIKGFNKTHALLLAYLRARPDNTATVAELRLIVGDQVHTERRLRDLRDLGFNPTAVTIGGQPAYHLASHAPDVPSAVGHQLNQALRRTNEGTGAAQTLL